MNTEIDLSTRYGRPAVRIVGPKELGNSSSVVLLVQLQSVSPNGPDRGLLPFLSLYHHKCAGKSKPKPKSMSKPPSPPSRSDGDQGRKLRKVVDKIERKAAIQKDMARIRRIRGR